MDPTTVATAIDPALAASGYFALATVVVRALTGALKSPLLGGVLDLLPARYRPAVPLLLGVLAGVLSSVAGGLSWQAALVVALSGPGAWASHAVKRRRRTRKVKPVSLPPVAGILAVALLLGSCAATATGGAPRDPVQLHYRPEVRTVENTRVVFRAADGAEGWQVDCDAEPATCQAAHLVATDDGRLQLGACGPRDDPALCLDALRALGREMVRAGAVPQ